MGKTMRRIGIVAMAALVLGALSPGARAQDVPHLAVIFYPVAEAAERGAAPDQAFLCLERVQGRETRNQCFAFDSRDGASVIAGQNLRRRAEDAQLNRAIARPTQTPALRQSITLTQRLAILGELDAWTNDRHAPSPAAIGRLMHWIAQGSGLEPTRVAAAAGVPVALAGLR
jgi:hypothetical protein